MRIFPWEILSYPSPLEKTGITSKCMYCGTFTSITSHPAFLGWVKGRCSKKQTCFPTASLFEQTLHRMALKSPLCFSTHPQLSHTRHEPSGLTWLSPTPSSLESAADTHCCACNHPTQRYSHWFSFLLLLFVVPHIIEAALSASVVNLSHCLTTSLREAVRVDSQ